MSGRQLSAVELGTMKFEQAQASRLWPCEFVWNGKEEISLQGDWMDGTVDLELGGDRNREVILELPEGKHKFQLLKGGMDVKDGRIDVKDLEGLISKLASSRFGGKALRNVAEEKGNRSGAKQLQDGSVEFTYNDVSHAKNVRVKGNFSDEELLLEKIDDFWVANTKLEPGSYTFRFCVDVGESTKAEAGPRSRLGWHAGSSTQNYLATNLQQVVVAELPEMDAAESEPIDLIKKTTLTATAEKTAPEAPASKSPTAKDLRGRERVAETVTEETAVAAKSAAKVPEPTAEKGARPPVTQPAEATSAAPVTATEAQSLMISGDKANEQKQGVSVLAVGGAIVAGVLLLLLRGGSDPEPLDAEPRFRASELTPQVEVVRAGAFGSEFFAEVEKDAGLLRLGRGL